MATRSLSTLLVLLSLLVTHWSNAAGNIPTLGENDVVELEPYLQQWIPRHQATFDEVLAADQNGLFAPTRQRIVPKMHRDIWYKFSFNNRIHLSDNVVLNFREFFFDDLDIHYRHEGRWQVYSTGLSKPYHQRPINYRYIAAPIPIKPDVPATVYFRINAYTPSLVVPALETPHRFFSGAIQQTIASVLIIGAMAGMSVYLWAISRLLLTPVKHYSLAGFLLSTLLFTFFYDGHFISLMGTWTVYSQALFALMLGVWNISFVLFFQQFFNLKQRMRNINHACNLLIIINAIALLGIGVEGIAVVTLKLMVLVVLIVLVISINAFHRRLSSSGYFLVAVLLFLTTITLRMLMSTGTLAYTPHERSLDFAGNLIFMLVICMAVTHRFSATRSRQLNLERKAIASEAREIAKNQFLAAMSHEIRTPANGVLGMAELLNESRLDSTQSHYVNILLSSAKSLISIVNDILDLHKVETNRLELEAFYFNLDQLLVSTLANAAQSASNHPYKYDLKQVYPLPFYLKGDPARLQQIIKNILNTVEKYTQRGAITLQAREVAASDGQATIKFSIIISDPHSGGELLAIFNNSESSLLDNDNSGVTIGVTIAKRLIALMGGEVGAESQPGRGPEIWFTVTFDIDLQRQAALEEKVIGLKNHRLACVFISPRFTRGLSDFFSRHQVSLQALDYDLELDQVDFASIDMLLLSNSTGEHTRRWLYAAQEHDTPVVMFNNFSNNIVSSAELNDLAIGVVNPPYGISDVIDVINKTLSGQLEEADITADKDLSRLRVLVAEDNPINTKVAQAMLENNGVNADFVTNGKEAVSAYQQAGGNYDLILMDCEMPEMDGFEATHKIRDFEADHELDRKVIYALTAYAVDEYTTRCLEAGMDGVLIKPLQKALLLEVLQSL